MPNPARTLIGISLFNAMSAIGGGIGLVTGALPVPTSLLRHTPFDTYVVPGLFLTVVIGGSSLAGALALLTHTPRAQSVGAATGLMMVGWILGETIIVQGFSWLQGLYLLTGLLLAVGSWYVPTPPRPVTGEDDERATGRAPLLEVGSGTDARAPTVPGDALLGGYARGGHPGSRTTTPSDV
jgi:hypothetical protein